MKGRKLFIVFGVIIFLFTIQSVGVFAISQADISSNLQKMKNKYPNGSHWGGTYYANDGSEGPWECFGFACEVFRGVFGCEMPRAYTSDMWHFANTNNVVCVGSIANPTESKVKNLLSTAKPGDIIQARGNIQHTMVVTNASSLGINVFDANSDGKNTVRVGAYLSHATVAGTYYIGLSLYRYKNYPTNDDVTPAAPNIRLSGTTTTEDWHITASWDSVPNAAKYEYYVSEFPEGYAYTTNAMHGFVTGTSVDFTGLKNGRYTVFVHAISASGKISSQSQWLSFEVYAPDYIPVKVITYNNHIYALYDYEMSWSFARDLCTNIGGHLATVTNENENNVIKDLINYGNKDAYWLGASDYDRNAKDFAWVTGENFSYSDWANDEPNNDGAYGEQEHFLSIKKSYGSKWNDAKNTAKSNKGFILEIDTENITPIATEYYNGNSYMVFDRNTTWTEAKQYCEMLGGHLATINNDEENEFIKNLILKGNRIWYYLGAEKINNIWQWLDGNDFSNITWHEDATLWSGTHLMMYKTSLKCIGLNNMYFPAADLDNIGYVCEIEHSAPAPTELFSITKHDGYSEIYNNTSSIQSATVIIGEYTNGVLSDIATHNETFSAGETKIYSNGANARIFVWDSLNGMKPLCSN